MAEEKKTTHDEWKAIGMTLVKSAVQQSSSNILSAVQQKIDHTTHRIVQSFVMVFLVLLGAAFVLVGSAQLLGDLLGNGAYGYLILGGVVLVVAGLMKFASRS